LLSGDAGYPVPRIGQRTRGPELSLGSTEFPLDSGGADGVANTALRRLMTATHAHTDLKFRLDVEPERDAVRVCPHGEVDLATTGEIREKFEEMTALGFRRVALDLRGVTFLDSSGVSLVLELCESSRAGAWEFAILAGPVAVERVFELTGVRSQLPFIPPTEIRYARWSRS
jgi:anti-sigma B factor antagonist